MKYLKLPITLIIFLLLFFLTTSNVFAIYNPVSVPNNHFGMHIVDTTDDLDKVAKLVNSNGGDWGYVTLVIQKGERDANRWQGVFDQMRRLHLIPIVRIATAPNGEVWKKPSLDEIDGWVSFLNSLNWVIKNRYVIVGNEVNHASEWGGEINPVEYSDYYTNFAYKLKASNEDFFIMPAGLDASAGNTRSTMEESLYLNKILQWDRRFFQHVDGWDSHSYPNPNFSGSGDGVGRGTVRTYAWELDYLKSLRVSKDFPVFITETGWIHDSKLDTNIGPKLEKAFNNAWGDRRVIAVTPFIFNYSDPPFDIFSWVRKDGQFYDFYYNYLNLAKIKGVPIQETRGEVISQFFPSLGQASQTFKGLVFVKNTGQSIWQKEELNITPISNEDIQIDTVFPDTIEPNQTAVVIVAGKFPVSVGTHPIEFQILRNMVHIGNEINFGANITPTLPQLKDVLGIFIRFVLTRLKG